MKLSKLLKCDPKILKCGDIDIKTVTSDSRKTGAEALFVCVRGARADGHDYAISAYSNGCRVFVCERQLDLPSDAEIILPYFR